MATIVLSTVGTALAGPIGGVLGSLVGQSIDQQLMGGGPRKAPRLGDLSVQTSSYGSPIPRIYGTMRVAGTVVWATELRENSELQGDGKSQPETVVYTYAASFAVALSSRESSRVERIWADGKLIRGAAGDMKVPGTFRFYPGSETQPVDPAIETEEGVGKAPAYRGLALAVFEDLQLGEFGNRIPTGLTFELVADDGEGLSVGELLNDASQGAIECADGRMIGGYAAYGDDVRAALGGLIEALPVDLFDDGDALRSPSGEAIAQPSDQELGASAEIGGAAAVQREQVPATGLPSELTLSYYEPSRDYQSGQVRVSARSPGRTTRSLSLPCVLDAAAAKGIAEGLLLRAWAMRERATISLPAAYLHVRPGTRFLVPGIASEWIAEAVEIERFAVIVTLRPLWTLAASRVADPGRPASQPDLVAAPTRLALFDLPDPGTDTPTLMLAAASPSGGWRSVPIEIEANGTTYASRTAMGEAIIGSALGLLGNGQACIYDEISTLEVQLANADHWLQSRDATALAAGANLAMVGSELVQFGRADALAPGRFRLSRFLRGRGGSEWAIAGHGSGEQFVLIDQRALKPIALPAGSAGANVKVTAHGVGDRGSPPSVSRPAAGEAMRPLSPSHLTARFAADGSLAIHWVRRSRLAWQWSDEIEAPTDSDGQGFRVKVAGTAGALERDVVNSPVTLSSTEIGGLGAGPLGIELRQIGALALSRPAAIAINA